MHKKTTAPSQQNTVIEPSTINFQQALSLHQQGQLEQAERLYEQLLKEQPQHVDALHFLGVLVNQRGQSQQAVELISQTLEIAPNNAAAHSNLGLALQELKRFDEAIACYDRSLALKPNNAEAHCNRGNALLALKHFDEAMLDYERALAIKPDYAEAFSNRGNLLSAVKHYEQALVSYESALAIKPDYAEALVGCGAVLQNLKRFNEAIIHYNHALAIKPDLEFILSTRLYTKMSICAWHEFDHDLDELTKAIERGEKVSIPFTIQAVSSSAALQKRVAEIYSRAKHPSAFLLPPLIKYAHSKIKIGYFSSDFCNHPVAYLTAELFERHDRSRFEIIAFSFHAGRDKDDMRLRLETAFDQFIDVSEQSDEQVVRLARQLEIDIAVDLNGCTEGCRTDIFALRATPIQVNYIGYLGTMGADYIDYLLADSVLIPTEHQAYYQEKIVYLPHSFQVNDSTLQISTDRVTRAALGLPEQGVVFCCFNNHYKITPTIFASWMRILHRVEGSVLWLIGGNVEAETNLRLSATAQGVAAQRLVFAQRVPMPDYLARHRLADVFLDTSPYNAGATASAALWAGLPLITMLGSSYSSRMAASLLNAIGLPELISTNLEDYEALAIQLATHPKQLAALKQKLADNRLTTPLFNTALFTQHIESAFQMMFDRYQAGLAPDHIYVSTQEDVATLPPCPIEVPQHSPATQTTNDKFQQALSLHQQGQLAQAERLYQEILLTEPQHVDVLHFLGVLKNQNGQPQLAVELISQSLEIAPNNSAAHSNLGLALHELKCYNEAIASYDRTLALKPNNAEAYYNRGNALLALKCFDEAILDYDRALAIKPDYAEAFSNRGNVLLATKRYEQALASYEIALAIKPDFAEALASSGAVLNSLKRFTEALISYERALAIKPDLEFILGARLNMKMNVCNWHEFECNLNDLTKAIAQGEKVVVPFSLLAMTASLALQKQAAEIYTQTKYPSALLLPPLVKYAHSKIKIGYFSSDFRQHPVAYLAAELFDRHDRSRFEIIAFSSHATTDKDEMRLRLEAAFDRFIDVSEQSDEQIAQLARQLEIDIAVDLNGCTEGCRTGLFAMRVAPIQVSYLGYAGTMGADYIDYLLADSVVIPVEYQPYYTEKIVYLPNSYMVNDSHRPIADRHFTRSELDLPEQGLIFCCFNNAYKITPAVFDVWMRLLHRIEGSVLWLSESHVEVISHLQYEAKARGIAPERLIFAKRLASLPEHLARHRLADLFLDTLPYNAHTTSSDALWTGLPVLTCVGEAFASRVAASLLTAIGLPELITTNLEDYEALAIQLATHPEHLAALKQKLADNRLTTLLFDTKLFTQHIESAFQMMFDRYQAGLAPDHIYMSAQEDVAALPSTIEVPQHSPATQTTTDKFQQALSLHQQGQLAQAERLYQEILLTEPQHVDVLHFLGVLKNQNGQPQLAVELISQSLEIAPNNSAAHSNLGLALHALKRYNEAIASYDRALAIKPSNADAHFNRGHSLRDLKRFDEAIASYERALAIKPDLEFILGARLNMKMNVCNWHEFECNLNDLTKAIAQGEKVVVPFSLLAMTASLALQKQAAEIYTQTKYPSALLLPPLVKYAHSKIKIGYFSSDFRQHPVAYLAAELFDRHDRSRFEIIAFSSHATTDKDEMRLRLEAAFDRFIDVSEQSDEQIAQLARQLEIDIAVDLNGCTEGCRTGLFAMRVAPIQVSYLGYAGTMGADYIDYLLADSVVIPVEYQPYYTEKIVYLPNSYMVNDSHRPIADRHFTRSELDLPEQGLIFCCFNNAYKITPAVFDVWMRLLHRIEGSVLWLSESHVEVISHLQYEAKARGIAPERLIFAKRLASLPEHLARHRLADLFLDTLPYNAHTTSSDALWTGLPVLTCVGEAFASRVAASLLTAIGLPELITTNLEDYEALAIQLATHPEHLAALKQKLADNRLTTLLFDTKLFTQHIESAFQMMFDRYQAGLAPDHIYVSADSAEANLKPVQQSELTSDSSNKFQRAVNYHQQGLLAEAEQLYKDILQSQPQHADSLHLLGVIAKQRGQAQLAADLINQALDINPNNAAAHSNIGLAYQELNRFELALASYDRALSLEPHYADAYFNRGTLLLAHKEFDHALSSYDQALIIKPDYIEALFSRGIVLKNLKRHDQALTSYDRALNIKPDYIEALINKANVLQDLKRYDEALASCERALAIKPEYAEALFGCAVILLDMKRFKEAHAYYERALALKPKMQFMLGDCLYTKMHICDWHDFEYQLDKLSEAIGAGEQVVTPFAFHAMSPSISLQKKVAEIYTQTKYPSRQLSYPLIKSAHSKIKIGYFSSDFRNHPTSHLMVELFERHDRTRFEIIAFSFSPVSHKDDMRLRLEAIFDQFIDISQQLDKQSVQLARNLELDIAVDLNGYTNNCRTDLFVMRVAPVQVSYLGYPGTMAAEYIDYLLADPILIPSNYQHYYTEKIAYLPNSYQVNDSNRPVANREFTRAELGLPAQGFVFCCFNNNHKITPTVFASWMRLLHHVQDSVLWLLEDNTEAANNLRLQATAQGIEANRLVFAKRLAMPEHLARHRLADLFLDTLPYNAHTTASDALWVGLPVLTYVGEAFASRVAASLLNALGLPELITTSTENYEALAIQLATHPEQLAALKQKLAANRLTTPLFNTALFTQHIESAFQAMFDRYQAGLAPDHIYVSAQENVAKLLPTIKAPQQIQTLTINQNQADALYNQGNSFLAQQQFNQALLNYDQVLTISPNHAQAHCNRGVALQGLRRLKEALASYDRALVIKPDYTDALYNRGIVLRALSHFNQALSSYEQALSLDPDYEFLLGTWLHMKLTVCDWHKFDQHLNQLTNAIEQGRKVSMPFFALAFSSSAALQKIAAEVCVQAKCPSHFLLPPLEKHTHSKIKIAYFSSDFRNHPVAYLTAELFECHDRSQFEIIAFSFSLANHKDEMRLQLEDVFDQFIDVTNQSDEQVVRLARELEIDIAVDLNGFTDGCRPNLFAMRVAPIQVNYLGYSGTMGADYMDYILADSVLIPTEYQPYYTEFCAYLPNSYMVNDSYRPIADKQFTRSEFGLPEQCFVFCCFNHAYKITPAMFDVWMRLLHRIENSVLWLSENNADVVSNLQREAKARGIVPNRLIFAKRLPSLAEHLARHRLADLFLDTFPYNAHTTSSDALWVGLPVLTCVGEAFASRVAASLLSAIGLPELITSKLDDYEALAIKLATHPEQLAIIKKTLADNRLTTPLFNTVLFTQHIELAFQMMFDRYQADLAPEHLYVPTQIPTIKTQQQPLPTPHVANTVVVEHQPKKSNPPSLLAKIAKKPAQLFAAINVFGKRKNSPLAKQQPLTLTPTEIDTLAQAQQLHQQGQLAAAELLYQALLKTQPEHADALRCLAAIKKQRQTRSTVDSGKQILHISSSKTPLNKGLALQNADRLNEAPVSVDNTLAIKTNYVEELINRGNELEDLGHFDEALASYDRALSINPDYARAHSNRGNVLQILKRFDEALESYDRALTIRPNYPEAFYNRGNTLQACKRFQEALASYDHALRIKPDFIEALIGRGNALHDCKQFSDALISYERVLTILPDYAEARYNYGKALHSLKRFDEALANYQRALIIKPDYIEALIGQGSVLQDLKRFNDALNSYERVLTVKPDSEFMFCVWLSLKMKLCDWRDFDTNLDKITQKITRGEKAFTPFFVHSMSSSPALQQKAAVIYAQTEYPSNFLLPAPAKHAHSKIKLAYFSADFRNHPIAHLMAELFECHDRSRFEVIAFSLHDTSHKDESRLRLESVFDQFIDVSQQSDEQVVQLARELEIDIAIDLNGFTEGCRTDIFALRAAPIQVNYIGYLGTMGADYIDYLLADSVLIPTEHQAYYQEKIVYLPHSFQVNDSTLQISTDRVTRAALGLPEQGVVFCCFNNHYKITPTIFASWMRILHRVEGSVLWLIGGNVEAETNLRLSATAQGVAAQRLVFAQRVPMPDYLARHRLADVFLDTSPYNAGATASAALWAGLPLITMLGSSYSSRMAASLLNAIGLPELISTNLEDYEALAIQLATHPKQLAALKQKLADNRLTTPLFNTALFTQHIESAFQMMFDRYQAGLAPDHIYVSIQEKAKVHTATLQAPIELNPSPASNDKFQQALSFHQHGQLAEAEALYEQLLQTDPQHVDVLHFLGILKNQNGQPQLAVDLLQQSLNINPNNAEAQLNLALVLQTINRFDEALASYDRALALKPDYDEALFNRANLLLSHNYFDQALANYEQVLAINPNYVEALCNRGVVLQGLQRFDDALASYNRALTLKPDYAEVLTNRGNTLKELKRFNDALDSYNRALVIVPDDVETLSNRGNILQELRRLNEALNSYDRALEVNPNYTEALSNRATVLCTLKRYDEALPSYERALVINSNYTEALLGCGVVLQELKRFSDTIIYYERALAIKPDHAFLFGAWLFLKMKMCDWKDFEVHHNKLVNAIEQDEKIVIPFSALAITSSAALQKRVAEIYSRAKHPSAFLLPPLIKYAHSKIKIGYFSSDFCNHPVAYLTAELFERHDRSRFEIIAFSFHAGRDKDDMRLRLETAFDQFIDVSEQSDEQVVRLARQLEIDIAVDLNGCTEGCRTDIFALRATPIQVNYIGYLGTMGADYIDYLLADSVLIPTEHQAYYQEKIVYLPHSFQVNDSTLQISTDRVTRAALGLPEQGVVFCCFNNHYKITPTIFASWMRILHRVEGSVLWLIGGNVEAETNLRLSATAQGVAAQRLVFAQRVPMPDYLARHRLADVFLDTSPYNAGATASAALWAGLPLITMLGSSYSSRMAASLLNAIGLPELISTNLEDYEALAIQLATHPKQLAALKQKLADNRLTTPLFNTALFTQHIESAFQMMFDRYQAGLAPDHIYVSTQEDVATLPPCPIEVPQHSPATQTTNDKFQQALSLHQQGQLAQAERLYQEILLTEPQHVDVLHFLGVLKNQNGQPQLAVELIQQSLTINANNAGAYSNLGMVLQALNRVDEALICYDKALELTPNSTDVLLSQANLLQALNRPDEALISYNKILAIKPDFIDALIGRGVVLQVLTRFDEALINYNLLLSIDTDHAEALFGRANALYNLKRLDEALDSYNRSLAINPNSFEVLYNRGVILVELNRVDEAIISYQDTLAINPDYAEAHNNLGNLLKKQHRYLEAEASYQRAIVVRPDYSEAHCNLINLQRDQGLFLQAEVSLTTALVAAPDSIDLRFIQLIMSLPVVPKSTAASVLVPSQFDEALTNLSNWLNSSASHQESLNKAELLPLPFLLAYRAGNHIQRLSRYGDLVASSNISVSVKPLANKIRMVVVSHHFRRHSVWDVITRGLLVNLDRNRFELILYHLGKIEDQETAFAKSLANEWRDMHTITELTGWLAALETDAADVIFYPEIGMDPLSARLASHRFAALQIASWGHPITTGLPNIDLYFSGELLESPNADSHYRERLIRLPNTGCCTTPINISPEPLEPELLAQLTARSGIRFIIAQTIYKFDPADDALYATIASVVHDSVFILLRDRQDTWATDQIVARLEQCFVDRGLNPKQHLLVIPWQSMEKFQTLLDLCDVYLDCPSFSGYTTAWQAVHRGLPIVTLEGEFMRQRLAAGLLRKIGLTDTIASSREDYVQVAEKLAEECRNPNRRAARRHALKTAAPKADNDVGVVRAFEQSVLEALAKQKS